MHEISVRVLGKNYLFLLSVRKTGQACEMRAFRSNSALF